MNNRTDWPTLIGDVAYMLGDAHPSNPSVRIPVGTQHLADHLGFARMTVVGWINGSEPKHHDGEKIIETWCSLTGRARTFVPRAPASMSAAQMRN